MGLIIGFVVGFVFYLCYSVYQIATADKDKKIVKWSNKTGVIILVVSIVLSFVMILLIEFVV